MVASRHTQHRVDTLNPVKKTRDIRDRDLKGFGVRILPSGGKRYFLASLNPVHWERSTLSWASHFPSMHNAMDDTSVTLSRSHLRQRFGIWTISNPGLACVFQLGETEVVHRRIFMTRFAMQIRQLIMRSPWIVRPFQE